jgi:hypothetical protein
MKTKPENTQIIRSLSASIHRLVGFMLVLIGLICLLGRQSWAVCPLVLGAMLWVEGHVLEALNHLQWVWRQMKVQGRKTREVLQPQPEDPPEVDDSYAQG